MAVFKCKMCGGALEITEGITVAECEYCCTQQTVPSADNEKKMNLFTRANRLRAACEFDKASSIYESIIAEFPDEAEAYWGLVLCEYGIEYIDDPATGKKIPTCHRSSFESVMKNSNVELAQECADTIARRLYRDEAKQIEELRKNIISVSETEEPYDVFICYKETDFDGKRTLDSVLAQDIYSALTDKNYRVFFSRISLEDKLGVEFEPYIFAALNSAKIMLVIGTDYEYLNAVWVKNEWSRFLKLMAKDKQKHLVPCYKGIDVYDMPEEFARLQAQDLDKMGAVQDILRGVDKLLQKEPETAIKVAAVQQAAANPTVDSYLKRVFVFLEDGIWQSADEYCEKILDVDIENAQAYLGKLMAELQVSKPEDLKNQPVPFDSSINYTKIKRYGDETIIATLEGYIAHINERIEQERIKAEEERIRAEQERIRIEKEREEARIKAEREQEEARLRLEQEILRARQKIKSLQNLVVAKHYTVCANSDGTVIAVGKNKFGECNTQKMTDIIHVAAGLDHTVGLCADGTVVALGDNIYAQCNVNNWTDIIYIAAGTYHTAGVKSNGTVVATGYNQDGQCNVKSWRNIVDVSAGDKHTVGVKSDGTVVAAGNNSNGQCNVAAWKNITSVSAGFNHTVGLKADGTVVATGCNPYGQCNVESWTDIIAVSAGRNHTIGLKSDGTVVATAITLKAEDYGQSNVSSWRDIVAVSAGFNYTVGIRSNGTVVTVGKNESGRLHVNTWRLFTDVDSFEQNRQKVIENALAKKDNKFAWRGAGLCQHCGGTFKGLITKKCAVCGREKDY